MNNTAGTLRWGATTADEMMLIYVQYTDAQLTGMEEPGGFEEAFLQVAPNPFGDQTRVAFNLEAAADVELRVLDLMGREVAVLENRRLAPGVHEYQYVTNGLAPGVYLVRLEVDGKGFTRKILHN